MRRTTKRNRLISRALISAVSLTAISLVPWATLPNCFAQQREAQDIAPTVKKDRSKYEIEVPLKKALFENSKANAVVRQEAPVSSEVKKSPPDTSKKVIERPVELIIGGVPSKAGVADSKSDVPPSLILPAPPTGQKQEPSPYVSKGRIENPLKAVLSQPKVWSEVTPDPVGNPVGNPIGNPISNPVAPAPSTLRSFTDFVKRSLDTVTNSGKKSDTYWAEFKEVEFQKAQKIQKPRDFSKGFIEMPLKAALVAPQLRVIGETVVVEDAGDADGAPVRQERAEAPVEKAKPNLDESKRKIELPTEAVVQKTKAALEELAEKVKPEVAASPVESTISKTEKKNPKVRPGLVNWYNDFEAAKRASGRSGKPVLLFQLLGQLDQRFT